MLLSVSSWSNASFSHDIFHSFIHSSPPYIFILHSGAPLIAIVAALGLAVDLSTSSCTDDLDQIEKMHGPDHAGAVMAYITGKMDYLCTSRPTAVNLFNAMEEIKAGLVTAAKDDSGLTGGICTMSARQRMVDAVLEYAEFMLKRDAADNRNIGKHGADIIFKGLASTEKVTIVTICNTGALAVSSYGTALGVVRTLQERDQLQKIVALETRPYNQGSRLTAFEIVQDNLAGGTLICDSAAAALMRKEKVHAVVVGADRVCANGDTANKIGTYSLSVIAAAHGVPVYVAAPFTTLDVNLATGDQIQIEERPAAELLASSRAPDTIAVWNPAFDVTPSKYIAGIITEKGVIVAGADGTMNVAAFVAEHTQGSSGNGDAAAAAVAVAAAAAAAATPKLQVPDDYKEQNCESLPEYLAENAPAAMEKLGTTLAQDLTCVEMGDGNLNLVFIVTNTKHPEFIVIVKQALPYVRCVGESWPLTLERSYFEYTALAAQKEACPEFVPTVYFFSKPNGLMVMQYLPSPIIILRKGLVQGIRYPAMAVNMGTFCAKTLFKTSGFKLTTTQVRKQVEFWSKNSEMCALTEQVVFTEPYMESSNNRWTKPFLDDAKESIEKDVELKVAAARYKAKFVTETQCLIHGDLHSGSVMCAPAAGQTFVIDPEFAFYGPMAFDLGAFIANLFLAYVSQGGHNNDDAYGDWILKQVRLFWLSFCAEFKKLWADPAEHTGFLYGRSLLDSPVAIEASQAAFFKDLLADTLGFAGMKMLRRIVGIAHVEDLESIPDNQTRAICEERGLDIAKFLITSASSMNSIDSAVHIARTKQPQGHKA
jgi:5-methylthioribose kinase